MRMVAEFSNLFEQKKVTLRGCRTVEDDSVVKIT